MRVSWHVARERVLGTQLHRQLGQRVAKLAHDHELRSGGQTLDREATRAVGDRRLVRVADVDLDVRERLPPCAAHRPRHACRSG